jgi:hypothetical protein
LELTSRMASSAAVADPALFPAVATHSVGVVALAL